MAGIRMTCRVALLVLPVALMGLLAGTDTTAAAASSPEGQLRQLINEHRAETERCWNGERWRAWPEDARRTLARSPSLAQAARSHNATMVAQDCFAHVCDTEPDLAERIEAAGYPTSWQWLGETLAAGFRTAERVVTAWRNSPPHNRTLLDCRAQAVGLARTDAPDATYSRFWTADFGDVLEARAKEAASRTAFGSAPNGASLQVRADSGRVVFSLDGTGGRLVEVTIRNLEGRRLRTLDGGGQRLVWDGRSGTGARLAHGVLLYVARIATSQGRIVPKIGRLALLP